MAQAAKRACANTAGESHSIEATTTPERTQQDLVNVIELINQTDLWPYSPARLAKSSAKRKKSSAKKKKGDAKNKKKRVISFEGRVDKVWKLLTNTRGMSDRQEYNASYKVCIGIQGIIKSIRHQCGELSSPATRRNGLSALADIGEYVAESQGRLGSEVRKELGRNLKFVSTLRHIVTIMSEDERRVVRQDNKTPGGLWRRLKESLRTTRAYCLFDGFDSILEYFKMGPEESEDDEDEDEDEDEEEEEEEEKSRQKMNGELKSTNG
ncbi:hypothetical protein N7509_002982 [Penicillium cosmopolitanum]|uniref:Uncharacterized protein n=1 Tax=Penicillium cosmopolitanum TaxID=1131564 RepID=A0A9W9WA58_9EURO|nr:uncharacterized protein N7509_002982 [Penicillium cosmopolitanum]KAJ5409099.1 hypothetical protein N7509_002982 [Penicillium cosmopolitanum]